MVKMLSFIGLVVLCLGIGQAVWVDEMENPGAFEGDMILTPEQQKAVKDGNSAYASIVSNRWPKIIPYEIGPQLDGAKAAIQAAIKDYQRYTCLKFVPRNGESGYIRFYKGSGCSSPVGYHSRRNDISLAKGCWHKAIVIHEIMHSLGVYHEQSRPDRDANVEILWQNIQQGMDYNFKKQPSSNINSFRTPYDFRSVMHYSATAFSKNGRQTIKTIDPKNQGLIGQRQGFSDIDIKQLNRMYKCNGVTVGTDPPSTGSPNTKPPTQAPTGCVDLSPVCPSYAAAGYCTHQSYKDFMTRSCRKSCKLCSGGSCVDVKLNCRDFHSLCTSTDPAWKAWLTRNCAKYCKFC